MGGEVGNISIVICQEKVHDTDGKSEAGDWEKVLPFAPRKSRAFAERRGDTSPSTEEGGGEKVRGDEVVKSDWRGVYNK